jgi:hypothetical protein
VLLSVKHPPGGRGKIAFQTIVGAKSICGRKILPEVLLRNQLKLNSTKSSSNKKIIFNK